MTKQSLIDTVILHGDAFNANLREYGAETAAALRATIMDDRENVLAATRAVGQYADKARKAYAAQQVAAEMLRHFEE